MSPRPEGFGMVGYSMKPTANQSNSSSGASPQTERTISTTVPRPISKRSRLSGEDPTSGPQVAQI